MGKKPELPASLWRRASAITADLVLTYMFSYAVMFPLASLLVAIVGDQPTQNFVIVPALLFAFVFPFIVDFIYFSFCDSSRSGQTLGKKLLNIRIVCVEPDQILTPQEALFRRVLSAALAALFVPLFYGPHRPDQRFLHDLAFKTKVVEVPKSKDEETLGEWFRDVTRRDRKKDIGRPSSSKRRGKDAR